MSTSRVSRVIHNGWLPVLSVVAFGWAVMTVTAREPELPVPEAVLDAPRNPFNDSVVGVGTVEPCSENVAVGTHSPGIVETVYVKVGEKIHKGDPLFLIDDRKVSAEIQTHQAMLAAANAKLLRLESLPRPEEIPGAKAEVVEAQAHVDSENDLFDRAQHLFSTRSIGQEELVHRRTALAAANAHLDQANASLNLLLAGSWEADKKIARAEIAEAKAKLDQLQTDRELLCARAPFDAEILQVNIRRGEFVANDSAHALLILGDTKHLHLRINIDETDIPRYKPGKPGVGMVRGDANCQYPLEFVRVEPYVMPKTSLTGSNRERVDTRVLQVVYRLGKGNNLAPVYVGQQMDAFFPTSSLPTLPEYQKEEDQSDANKTPIVDNQSVPSVLGPNSNL